MNYSTQGAGLPVVLLHGFPLDQRIWATAIKSISKKYQTITPDLPGFGKSASTGSFTLDTLADAVHQFLTDLKLLPCVLGGLSMGGYTTLAYIQKYSATLKGVMLIDTRAESDTPEGKAKRNEMIELVRTKGSTAVADQMLPRMLAPGADAKVARELKSIMDACPAKTIEYALGAMRDRPDRSSLLPSISVPTLILVGDNDVITPPSVADQMHKSIPHSKLEIIKNAGHMTPMEQPAQTAKAIDHFLQSSFPVN